MKNLALIFSLVLAFACKESSEINTMAINSESKQLADYSLQTNVLPELLKKAKNENKKLFLVFGFGKCSWCIRFKNYHADPEVAQILNTYFTMSEIDYDKTPGGKELYRKYGSVGFPCWTILDSTGTVLINSEAPLPGAVDRTYIVGYPAGKEKSDYYIKALESATAIAPSECEVLRRKIEYFQKN